MAILCPPFVLCPLSESKDLLGISGDRIENRIIVTIGKNIAIRYHVAEQKQEVSWTSSRHWITSKVVFCSEIEKYGSVIDHNVVALWDEADAHLATLKKYKFDQPLLAILPTKNLGTLVVFKNGLVRRLSEAKSDRTATPSVAIIDQSTERIIDISVDEKTNYVFLLVGNKALEKRTFKCSAESLKSLKVLTVDLGVSKAAARVIHRLEIPTTEDSIILGYCIIPNGNESFLLTLRSDGHLYRQPLIQSKEGGTEEPSRVALISKYVSCSNPVVIKSLDPSTIVLYGCDPSEEGSTVFIYDISFDLLLSRQSLKLYGSPPIMEKVGPNVFVPVGLNILVLGLRVTKSLLSAVMGRHRLQGVDFFENRDPWAKGWDPEGDPEDEKDGPEPSADEEVAGLSLINLVNTLESNGQPQSMICGQVVPQIIENQNFEALDWLLGHFIDIPELQLINILTLLFSTMDRIDEDSVVPQKLEEQVNQILGRPFDQRQMISNLRKMDFDLVKKVLAYLSSRLESCWRIEIEDDEGNRHEISQLMKWASAILDAHYPQFVFHNETGIIDTLLTLIESKSKVMNEIESLEPLLTLTIMRTSFQPGPSPNSKYRSETVLFD